MDSEILQVGLVVLSIMAQFIGLRQHGLCLHRLHPFRKVLSGNTTPSICTMIVGIDWMNRRVGLFESRTMIPVQLELGL